jgi:hypothetical protein
MEKMTDDLLLGKVNVASPCHASWDAMEGDDKSRFCGQCQKNVYNLSAMTKKEAADLVRNQEGRLCVRYFKRADGTMLTADCPVGAGVKRRKAVRNLAVLAGTGAALAAYRVASAPQVTQPTMIALPMATPEPQEAIAGAVAVPHEFLGYATERPTMGEAPMPEEIQGKLMVPQERQGRLRIK